MAKTTVLLPRQYGRAQHRFTRAATATQEIRSGMSPRRPEYLILIASAECCESSGRAQHGCRQTAGDRARLL